MRKVIVVENNEGIRELLADLLTLEGFQVNVVGEDHSMFEQLEQEEDAVVLLDLGPPSGGQNDERSVLAWLQEGHSSSHHQIIAMSASMPATVGCQLRAAGLITAFLSKPFDLEDVLAAVQQVAI